MLHWYILIYHFILFFQLNSIITCYVCVQLMMLLPLYILTWNWPLLFIYYTITPVPPHLGFSMLHVYMVEKSWTINQPYYKTSIKYITFKSSFNNLLRVHSYFYTMSSLSKFGKLFSSSGRKTISKL